MERVIGSAQLLDEFHRHAGASDSVLNRVRTILPGPLHGRGTEGIASSPSKRMPIDDAEPKMVPHRLPFDQFIRVIPAECQRVLGLRTFVADVLNFREECRHKALGIPKAVKKGT